MYIYIKIYLYLYLSIFYIYIFIYMYHCTSLGSAPVQDQSDVPVLDWFSFLLILVTPGEIIPSCYMRLMIMNRHVSFLSFDFAEQGKGPLRFQMGRCLCDHLLQKKKMLRICICIRIHIYICMYIYIYIYIYIYQGLN